MTVSFKTIEMIDGSESEIAIIEDTDGNVTQMAKELYDEMIAAQENTPTL